MGWGVKKGGILGGILGGYSWGGKNGVFWGGFRSEMGVKMAQGEDVGAEST